MDTLYPVSTTDPQSWGNVIPTSGQEDGQFPAGKSEVAEEADELPGVNDSKGTTVRVRGTHEAHRDPKEG